MPFQGGKLAVEDETSHVGVHIGDGGARGRDWLGYIVGVQSRKPNEHRGGGQDSQLHSRLYCERPVEAGGEHRLRADGHALAVLIVAADSHPPACLAKPHNAGVRLTQVACDSVGAEVVGTAACGYAVGYPIRHGDFWAAKVVKEPDSSVSTFRHWTPPLSGLEVVTARVSLPCTRSRTLPTSVVTAVMQGQSRLR